MGYCSLGRIGNTFNVLYLTLLEGRSHELDGASIFTSLDRYLKGPDASIRGPSNILTTPLLEAVP